VHDHPRRRRGDLSRRPHRADDQRPGRHVRRDRRQSAAEGPPTRRLPPPSALLRDAQPHHRLPHRAQPQLRDGDRGLRLRPPPRAGGAACRRSRAGAGRGSFNSAVTTPQPGKDNLMKRSDLTEKILDIKRAKGWTWKYICEQIGGMSPVMITGGVLGQQKMTKPMAAAAAKVFGLSKAEETMLNEVPYRGTGTPMPPTDTLIYRFYEL